MAIEEYIDSVRHLLWTDKRFGLKMAILREIVLYSDGNFLLSVNAFIISRDRCNYGCFLP